MSSSASAPVGEVCLQPGDRVSGFPRRYLGGVAVARRVVGVGVCLDAVGVRLDQERLAVRAGGLHRVAKHGEHRHEVVAVHLLAADAVPDPLCARDGAAVCFASGTEIAYRLF